jgi:hypothetical protein
LTGWIGTSTQAAQHTTQTQLSDTGRLDWDINLTSQCYRLAAVLQLHHNRYGTSPISTTTPPTHHLAPVTTFFLFFILFFRTEKKEATRKVKGITPTTASRKKPDHHAENA